MKKALLSTTTVVLCCPLAGIAAEKLYVLSSNAQDMAVIDVATDKILRYVEVGDRPHGIAAPRSHAVLWVATEYDNSLTAVNPVTDKVIAKYPIFGRRPNEIEITPDGSIIYVPVLTDGLYEVFDTRSKKIIKRIPTNGFPHNVVCNSTGTRMYLSPYDRGRNSAAVARKQGLPTRENLDVYVVDTKTHSVITTIRCPHTPRPIAISPDDKWLYVNTDDFMGFVVLDLTTNKLVYECPYELTDEEKEIPSRSHGIVVTPDGREVWSTDINHSLIHVFDVTQRPPKQVARVRTGKLPLWVTVTPTGRTIYVANTGEDTVSAIDMRTKKERTRIHIGGGRVPKRMLVLTVPAPSTGK